MSDLINVGVAWCFNVFFWLPAWRAWSPERCRWPWGVYPMGINALIARVGPADLA